MNTDDLYESAINHWRENKGIGTAFIPSSLDSKYMLYGVLQRFYSKSTSPTLIIVPAFNVRTDIVEFLTHQNCEENDKEFTRLLDNKTIKIYTFDYVENMTTAISPFVSILYKCDSLGDNVFRVFNRAKFKLAIISKYFENYEDTKRLYDVAPLLPDFKQNEIDMVRLSTPVEEEICPIVIPEDSEEGKLLAYYNQYVSASLNIFGDFGTIEYARKGNPKENISSMQVCYQIAYANGWNPSLDMNMPFNITLDEMYNPNAILERANKTYEIVRERSKLLTDYEGKLDKILEIVNKHKDEKILIISKRGEFASRITDYLNNMSEKTICGNYHDKAEPILASDYYGNPVYIKSGPHKGERRTFAAQAQKSMSQVSFNNDIINVISTNNSPDKSLCIEVDVVIITSSVCEPIESFMYRLNNIFFRKNKIRLYTLFIRQSLEETKLSKRSISPTHTILNNNTNIEIIENNFDYIVVD